MPKFARQQHCWPPEKSSILANFSNWHAFCITQNINHYRHSQNAGGHSGTKTMTKFHFDSIKSLSIAAFTSATALVMLLSIAGLNGAPIGQLIV
jgi:hypothetical protein